MNLRIFLIAVVVFLVGWIWKSEQTSIQPSVLPRNTVKSEELKNIHNAIEKRLEEEAQETLVKSRSERVYQRNESSVVLPENESIKSNLPLGAKTLEQMINEKASIDMKSELEAVKSPF